MQIGLYNGGNCNQLVGRHDLDTVNKECKGTVVNYHLY